MEEVVNIVQDFWTFSVCSTLLYRVSDHWQNIPEALNLEHSHRGPPQSQCSQNVLQNIQMCSVILTPLWTSTYFFVASCAVKAEQFRFVLHCITWSGERTWCLDNMQNIQGQPGGACKCICFELPSLCIIGFDCRFSMKFSCCEVSAAMPLMYGWQVWQTTQAENSYF